MSNDLARISLLNFGRALVKLPQYECEVKHYFVKGLYVREIFIPKGCAILGYIHMFPCITTISKGSIAISDGEKTRILSAPLTMVCKEGTQKAGYALEDTVWSDAYVNPDNELNIDKLEDWLTADTYEIYLQKKESLLIQEKTQ